MPLTDTKLQFSIEKEDNCWLFTEGFKAAFEAFGSLSPECWSSQNAELENTNFGEERDAGLVRNSHWYSKGEGSLRSFPVSHCSAPWLPQRFRSSWKRGIMQDRQHQMIGNSRPPFLNASPVSLSLSLSTAERVDLEKHEVEPRPLTTELCQHAHSHT